MKKVLARLTTAAAIVRSLGINVSHLEKLTTYVSNLGKQDMGVPAPTQEEIATHLEESNTGQIVQLLLDDPDEAILITIKDNVRLAAASKNTGLASAVYMLAATLGTLYKQQPLEHKLEMGPDEFAKLVCDSIINEIEKSNSQ